MIAKHYFRVQEFSFACIGIDLKAVTFRSIIKRPLLCYGPFVLAIIHCMAIIHYTCVHRHNYVEITDSLSLLCQSSLAIWKMLVFLIKRKQFVALITEIHEFNVKTKQDELKIVVKENLKEISLSNIYFLIVKVAVIFAFSNPILIAVYMWYTKSELILIPPYKATYFWPHSDLIGYSLVYLWNLLSIYFLVAISVGLDTLFIWLVYNISAQFHILIHRLHSTATKCHHEATSPAKGSQQVNDTQSFMKGITICIQYHSQVLKLAEKLNNVYGVIIFIKFIISCSQICCLAFRLSRPYDSFLMAVYQSLFLLAVALQLFLYCYNGQRIKDKSFLVASEIYLAFDWSQLGKIQAKLLLLPMMRSQKSSHISGIIFALDLNLYLWVFKTAGSLVTALKTLDENQQ